MTFFRKAFQGRGEDDLLGILSILPPNIEKMRKRRKKSKHLLLALLNDAGYAFLVLHDKIAHAILVEVSLTSEDVEKTGSVQDKAIFRQKCKIIFVGGLHSIANVIVQAKK